MTKIQCTLMIILIFAVPVIADLPPANKQATEVGNPSSSLTTAKFEYKIETATDAQFPDLMTDAGNEGWELVFARRAVKSGNTLSDAIDSEVQLGKPKDEATKELISKWIRGGSTYDTFNYQNPLYEMIFKRVVPPKKGSSMADVIKILAAGLAPIVAAFAVWIAFQQRRIAQAQARIAEGKLRLELFEKRYALFESIQEFLSKVLTRVVVSDQDLRQLWQEASNAYFLFGPEVYNYLDELYKSAIRLRGVNQTLQGDLPPGKERSDLVQREQDLLTYFEERCREMRPKFAKYLSLRFE